MNKHVDEDLDEYYRRSESWAIDRERQQRNSLRVAWGVAVGACAIALAEAVALAALMPLKTVQPYTLLVDRQTGFVQALKPLGGETIAPDRALVRSFLAQYVIARESFQIESIKDEYRKVVLWSADEARQRYIAGMQAGNPSSPLATLPRRALVEVEIRSISSLSANTALVRFATYRSDPGGARQQEQLFAAVVNYRFSGAAMSEADRLLNPLGFQVVRYRRDAEMVPDELTAAPTVASSAPAVRPTVEQLGQ